MLRLSTLPKWSIVAVEWEDALGDPSAILSSTFIAECEPVIMVSVGFFIGVPPDVKRVFLAECKVRGAGAKSNPVETDCQSVGVIPTGMITQINLLSRKGWVPVEVS